MPETRSPVKLDFITGLNELPPRPQMDATTTEASVAAGRQLGFSSRTDGHVPDGRRLRSRGANIQLNLKVTAEEKARILQEATKLIHDPASPVGSLGEFVVMAVDFYKSEHARRSGSV